MAVVAAGAVAVPAGARRLKAAKARPREVDFPERYTVCVRYNAKDVDGRYPGIKQGMAAYARGRFDRFVPQQHGLCDQAEYKPFSELEALGR